MHGDYTRMTFVPRKDPAGVLMQQGRVTLDADWNDLVEKAIAVDTATRLQNAWQVRLLEAPGGTTCGSDLPGWDALTAPSAGRLTTAAVGVPAATDPCTIPASGGFRGTENRLYRVEI